MAGEKRPALSALADGPDRNRFDSIAAPLGAQSEIDHIRLKA